MNKNEILERGRAQLLQRGLMSDHFLDFLKKNTAPYETLMAYYRCAIMEIETKFRVLNEQFSLQYDRNPIEGIKSRLKSTDSLVRKMRKKGTELSMEAIERDIWDVAGVRIICSFLDDIYELADCLLRQDDVRLIETRDYIKNPKPSGYRSLHVIVEVPIFLEKEKRCMKVEVQLRTIAMDFWASLEHKLRYKKNLSEEKQRLLAEELGVCASMSAELDWRMQKIREQVWDEEA